MDSLPKNLKQGSQHIVTSHKSVCNKNFLIETLLEMTDSTSPKFLMLESVLSVIACTGNLFVADRFMFNGNQRKTSVNLTSNFPAKLGFFDVAGNFDSHIQIPQVFLH